MSRISSCFQDLKIEGRAGLITFITAGDPDMESFETVLDGLPGAGADVIEIGMPFSDPMADGPAIQASGLRALRAGTKLKHILDAIGRFRAHHQTVPVVLMGYYNSVYRYGVERFAKDASDVGIDGLIIVDLPPEESAELTCFTNPVGLDFIRLTTPTSDERRLRTVLAAASGFIYHISIAGVTGTRSPDIAEVATLVSHLRQQTVLPVAVGFGIRTAVQAESLARFADAVVVGSCLVETIASYLADGARAAPDLAAVMHAQVAELAAAVRTARRI
jgi:tryptophan synthase alpha chain